MIEGLYVSNWYPKNILVFSGDREFDIWQIGTDYVAAFTHMVVKIYRQLGWVKGVEECLKLYREDRYYAPYAIFVAICSKKNGDVVGTFRMTLKERGLHFPFETFFGVDIEQLCREIDMQPREVWHCGRIVVDKVKLQQLGYKKSDSFNLLRLMIYHMYRLGLGKGDNLFFGENFEKTQRLYNMLGFPMRPCRVKEYLTVPVCASYMMTCDAPMYDWLLDREAV